LRLLLQSEQEADISRLDITPTESVTTTTSSSSNRGSSYSYDQRRQEEEQRYSINRALDETKDKIRKATDEARKSG